MQFYTKNITSLMLVVLLALTLSSCSEDKHTETAQTEERLLSKIAFGSCGHEQHPTPILDLVVEHKPDMFIFLGDNIYGDTKDMEVLKAKYKLLADKSAFQNLRANVPEIFAVWDDHDYGWNDIGRHYEFKKESEQIFLDFWQEPADSERRKREGIYDAFIREYNGKKLQIIMLDNRTFRDDLRLYKGEKANERRYFYSLDYYPHEHSDSTLLGETQWQWLEDELSKEADIRIVCSGTQFGIEYNGYEAWANFPNEQKRFVELVKKTRANGVMFITGDVHYAEISKFESDGCYPIYDITSSGLSSTWHFATPNANRIEGPIMDNHFGMLTIDWTDEKPVVKAEIWDIKNNQRIEHTIKAEEISF